MDRVRNGNDGWPDEREMPVGYGLQEHMPPLWASDVGAGLNGGASSASGMQGPSTPMILPSSGALQQLLPRLGMLGPADANDSSELTGLHRDIMTTAANTHLVGETPAFGVGDMLDYVPAWAGWKAGKDTHIFDFKDNWVSHYKDVLLDAAAKNDIPPEVLAGVAHIEAGGKPDISKEALYWTRKYYPFNRPEQLARDPEWTSFGDVAIQPRRAAASLGYDPAILSQHQHDQIMSSILDPVQNIYIAAKHLSDLRDHDFPDTPATGLTADQVRILGARYDAGPDVSMEELQSNRGAVDYGVKLTGRLDHMADLLGTTVKDQHD